MEGKLQFWVDKMWIFFDSLSMKEEKRVYEDSLERAREARFTKEQEFNELMDVKIALDAGEFFARQL